LWMKFLVLIEKKKSTLLRSKYPRILPLYAQPQQLRNLTLLYGHYLRVLTKKVQVKGTLDSLQPH
jgi:hypothetical protein